jgi:large subunit ribosomal protein L15
MKLNELSNDRNKRKKPKRVGRGIGSGTGKTGGRGQKGQTSRSGVSINGFEGGQMPIYRRLPKRGFVNPFKIAYQCVNIGVIQQFLDSGQLKSSVIINKEILLGAGIINRSNLPVKILAKGFLKTPVNFEVDAASAAAVKLVEKLGGKISVTAINTSNVA